jgi:hypothetical protein
LNPRSSSIYPSYCTDHAAPYWFEGNMQVHINKRRWEFGIVLFDSRHKFLEGFSEHGDFLDVCKREFLVVNRVEHLFNVEMKWLVLKLKMPQVTDVA